jgi:hypothetical protein
VARDTADDGASADDVMDPVCKVRAARLGGDASPKDTGRIGAVIQPQCSSHCNSQCAPGGSDLRALQGGAGSREGSIGHRGGSVQRLPTRPQCVIVSEWALPRALNDAGERT